MSNSTNPSLGYNKFDLNMSNGENKNMSEYIDGSGFRDSYSTSSTGVGTHEYPEIQRQPSKKLLGNNSAFGRGDSLRKLSKENSVKKTPLDKFDKKPIANNSTNPSLGYNSYLSNDENNRYTNEYEEMSDSSNFRDSYSTDVGTHDSVEAVIQRQPSKKLLINNPAFNNIGRGDSLRKLARGDTVKKTPLLDKFDPVAASGPAVTVKKPVTKIEKLQAWMINEGGRAIFFGVWITLHVLVFTLAFLSFYCSDNFTEARDTFGLGFTIAKSSALVLHFDAAIILFTVCRNLISVLRATPLNNIIPFDENIEFHKSIGWSILFFTLLHTVSHWINFAMLSKGTSSPIVGWLLLNFTTGPGATGYVMLVSLLIMVATAIERVRRSHFNRFWYLHHLFIPFFGAWAFHGAFCMIQSDREPKCANANFWKYWIASGVIYISERVLREIRARQKSYISKVVMHPSRVVEIQIKKPSMTTKAGQYLFLCCPEVSLWQWHPFTLTSAPEEDYVSVHIRVVGDFTKALSVKLGCNFDEELRIRKENKDRIKSQYDGIDISTNNPELQKVLPRIMIDGPFGSASEDVFKFEVAMLVGAGIGVTPFASILKSIWYRVNYPTKSTKLSKVYFFWVCRDYDSFEWFQSLLSAIEEQDIEQFIETHIYLTGRLRHSEVGNILVNDDGNIKDTITGLRAPTHFGRPNWDKIFSNMRDQYQATDIGVFFCGPKPLGKTLHTKCNLWSQGFEDGTRFFYGKENF